MATCSKDSRARIMLWGAPRSMSTAFARSMSARGDTVVFWEPYLNCVNYGADRTSIFSDNFPGMRNDKYTYSYIDKVLNANYPQAKVLFVKGMVEGIKDHFDVVDSGFTHSFIIRHPRKIFRSLLRAFQTLVDILPQESPEVSVLAWRNIVHDLERFYHYVENEFGQASPPIIDADDLASQPQRILPKYCNAMGIEYTPKMLEWESLEPEQLGWQCIDVGAISYPSVIRNVYLGNAMKGQRFESHLSRDMTLPNLLEECVQRATPVYEKMFELRIRP